MEKLLSWQQAYTSKCSEQRTETEFLLELEKTENVEHVEGIIDSFWDFVPCGRSCLEEGQEHEFPKGQQDCLSEYVTSVKCK
jgi:hypothetical protein